MSKQMMTKKADKTSEHIFSLSFIQVVCAISVVTLHTNGVFWQFSATERYWLTANIIESVFYFAVPIFFMITGITLLDYQDRYSTKVYFKKRIEKTVIPYIVWSLIGVAFLLVTNRISSETLTVKWVINGLISTNGIIGIYWFFQPLFNMYLCIPVFAAIDRRKKKRVAEYILLISLCVNILPSFLNSVFNLELQWPYSVEIVSGYTFWLWCGYYLYNYPPTKKRKGEIILFAIFGLMLHIIGTYKLSIEAGEIDRLYKGYNNLPCVLYSIGAFLVLRDIGVRVGRIRWLRKAFESAGKYTFALYLLHWFILRIREDLIIIDTRSIFWRLLAPYPIFLIVIVFTWFLRKVPVIRKIVP